MTKKLAIVAALGVMPVGMNAAVLVDTASFGPTTVPYISGVVLDQFPYNPALLTKVTLEISGTLSALITAENNTGVGVSAEAWIVGFATASGPSGLAPQAVFAGPVAGPIALDPSDGNPGSGPDWTNFGGLLSDNAAASVSTMNPGDFGPFLGGGTFPVVLTGLGGWAVVGVSDAHVVVSNFLGSGDVKVTYEYIPEPHEYAMFAGLGLLGMAALRRFKR